MISSVPGKMMKIERKIKLHGVAEGMGTRPALYRFSVSRGLTGYAVNRADLVEIIWQGDHDAVELAVKELPSVLPPGCRFTVSENSSGKDFTSFSIEHAPRSVFAVNLAAPPDRVPCAECLAEIMDPQNRHYHHAFNACAVCGPRTTVMKALPYDRENTSWSQFPLCPDCRKEYESPADRRFHIQGISCPVCGPHLQLYDAGKNPIRTDDPIGFAAKAVTDGRILALKGVGGFQLICSLDAEDTLRKRKKRPDKPFALMADSIETVRHLFKLSPAEEDLLISPAGPAVLLTWKNFSRIRTAPDSPDVAGVMLPSSPLHKLLLDATGEKIVIATSGNRSGLPPALNTEAALDELIPMADFTLTHDREIIRRNDDSVCAVTAGRKQVWRRARGFSSVFYHPFRHRILAVGAGMKNTFALSDNDRIYLSTHYGELDDARSYQAWKDALLGAVDGFPPGPEMIACDLHPDYPSSRFAAEFAAEHGIPLKKVPHHAAHALAAMLDAMLQKALVFVFDGTGLAPDGTIRGAELFRMDLAGECRRIACWKTVPLPGGDNAVLNPYIQLAARKLAAGAEVTMDRHLSDAQISVIKAQCRDHWNAPETGAAGRLFDSVSALLGLAPETITYDSQAAVRLETAARLEPADTPCPVEPEYTVENGLLTVDWSVLFRKNAKPVTPRSFHRSVADSIVRMADFALADGTGQGTDILLCGGVFQNRLLTEMVIERLEKKHLSVRLPSDLPPGDGCISCGQICWCERNMEMTGTECFAKGGNF